MLVVVVNWIGFYFGGYVGYGWNCNDFVLLFGFVFMSVLCNFCDQGFFGGGQVGYNWQVVCVVVGFELDGSVIGVKGSNGLIIYIGIFVGVVIYLDKINYLGMVCVCVGWLFNQNVLLYVIVGLVWE